MGRHKKNTIIKKKTGRSNLEKYRLKRKASKSACKDPVAPEVPILGEVLTPVANKQLPSAIVDESSNIGSFITSSPEKKMSTRILKRKMNNFEKNEDLNGLKMNLNSKFEIKEELIENYKENLCDENLNSDSLELEEQTNEIGINNSNSLDPNLAVKLEDDIFKMEIEFDYEEEMEHTLLNEYEIKKENFTEERLDAKKEGVPEESEAQPSLTEKETKIPIFSLNTDTGTQFGQLEASEFPKIIVRRVNVEEEKALFTMDSESFNDILNEKLIDLVREHPVLYDLQNNNYKDFAVRENVWELIALSLGKSVPDCKTRWTTIRDAYRKNKNRIKDSCMNLKFLEESFKERRTKSSMESPFEKDEDENLEVGNNPEYVTSSTSHVQTEAELLGYTAADTDLSIVSLSEPGGQAGDVRKNRSDDSDIREMQKSKRSKTVKERVFEEVKKGREERENILRNFVEKQNASPPQHPLETFFLSMARTAMEFPPRLIAETRVRVCQLISEMEMKALEEKEIDDQRTETIYVVED